MSIARPVAIVVRDGWGVRHERAGNAVALARTPRHDELWARFPTALVNASERHVGLPVGQMGNSDVGHLTMGAGRVVYQDLVRIDVAIERGELQTNEALNEAMADPTTMAWRNSAGVSSFSPVRATWPMNPPANVSPAPVGSNTSSSGNAGAENISPSWNKSAPYSPCLITTVRAPSP